MTTGFNLSTVFATVAAAVPDQEVLVHGGLRLTYTQVEQHADGLARFLASRGLGCHTERDALAGAAPGTAYGFGPSRRCSPVIPRPKFIVLASTDWSLILHAGGVANLMEWSGWILRLEVPGVVRWTG